LDVNFEAETKTAYDGYSLEVHVEIKERLVGFLAPLADSGEGVHYLLQPVPVRLLTLLS